MQVTPAKGGLAIMTELFVKSAYEPGYMIPDFRMIFTARPTATSAILSDDAQRDEIEIMRPKIKKSTFFLSK